MWCEKKDTSTLMCYQPAPNDGTKWKKNVYGCKKMPSRQNPSWMFKYVFFPSQRSLSFVSLFLTREKFARASLLLVHSNRLMNSIIELYCLRQLFLAATSEKNEFNCLCGKTCRHFDTIIPHISFLAIVVYIHSNCEWPDISRPNKCYVLNCWIQKKRK